MVHGIKRPWRSEVINPCMRSWSTDPSVDDMRSVLGRPVQREARGTAKLLRLFMLAPEFGEENLEESQYLLSVG